MEPYCPVVIVGAPRSGTNMLRDILCQLPSVATWPCDEINYLWRHGNLRASDELPESAATARVQFHMQKQFDWVAKRYQVSTVVEKTCANSLRIPFVNKTIPNAKYIFIRRDGLDVVGSAITRWKAELDIPYLARKTRFVPFTDLPYYGGRYIWNHAYRFFSREKRLAFWGPQLANMNELLTSHPLDEICALQWEACINKAADALTALPQERWLEVTYENFVTNPNQELSRILDLLQLEVPPQQQQHALTGVLASSLGKGRANLDTASLARLTRLIGKTLIRFGYH